jgi:hypothetical protein
MTSGRYVEKPANPAMLHTFARAFEQRIKTLFTWLLSSPGTGIGITAWKRVGQIYQLSL